MATNAPVTHCWFCGQQQEYEVAPHAPRKPWEPLVFGPTDWRVKPHKCPPGAVEVWVKKVMRTGR
jgi:hypothetical protein